MYGMLFAILPALILGMIGFVKKQYGFYAFFILNYVIMGIDRYIPLKSGMIMLGLAFGLVAILLMKNLVQAHEWKRCRNSLTAVWGIWFIYCFLELFNPNASFEPWSIAMPNYALYPLLCSIIVPIFFTKYRNFQWLLIIWAALTLIAAAKGYWQKNRGFDSAELAWLYYGGGASTHLIYSGIRFFSFFTDAASYGASMGISLVVFGISGIYTKELWIKLLFFIAAIGGGYGLIISGTRSDLAIPFVGLIVFLLLCRNFKMILITGLILISAFIFLKFTTIGNDNRLIRRMRTVFDKEDASWMIRVNNKERIYKLMQDKPFGAGLGLGGGKAKRFTPHAPLAQIPTDSWFIMAYVETGIVGIILYIAVFIFILLKGAMITSYNVINRELQGQLYAIIAAIAGILVTCYANEVLNYPNGIIIYTLIPFLFIAPYYDKELQQHEHKA